MTQLTHVHPPASAYGYDGLRIGAPCGCEWRKGDMAWFKGMRCTLDRNQHAPEQAIVHLMERPCTICSESPALFAGYNSAARRQAEAVHRARTKTKSSPADIVKLILGIIAASVISFAVFTACGGSGIGY